MDDTDATGVKQQELHQASSVVSGHSRDEDREPHSSNVDSPGVAKCRLPDCVQPQFFDDRKKEYLDYCRNHI